jgi:hypothetical protein
MRRLHADRGDNPAYSANQRAVVKQATTMTLDFRAGLTGGGYTDMRKDGLAPPVHKEAAARIA